MGAREGGGVSGGTGAMLGLPGARVGAVARQICMYEGGSVRRSHAYPTVKGGLCPCRTMFRVRAGASCLRRAACWLPSCWARRPLWRAPWRPCRCSPWGGTWGMRAGRCGPRAGAGAGQGGKPVPLCGGVLLAGQGLKKRPPLRSPAAAASTVRWARAYNPSAPIRVCP